LGDIQIVNINTDIFVGNIFGQHDIKPINGIAPIRYDAIRAGLNKTYKALNEAKANNVEISVHLPKIGAGLAGGDWNIIEKIIEEELISKGIDVTVYELPNEIEYANYDKNSILEKL
jgi:O-acetyl-ADP-ribose deacetylase (regulator of RNase III)